MTIFEQNIWVADMPPYIIKKKDIKLKHMNNILIGKIGLILVSLYLTQILKSSPINFNLVVSQTNF